MPKCLIARFTPIIVAALTNEWLPILGDPREGASAPHMSLISTMSWSSIDATLLPNLFRFRYLR